MIFCISNYIAQIIIIIIIIICCNVMVCDAAAAAGVPNDTVFETQTRKEISKVEFHPLNQLPKKIWGGE
jgi:hypothetical protein